MTLADGQLTINGFVFGDNINTFLEELTGWDDLPPVDSGNTPRPMYTGSFAGSKFARERIITWSGRANPPVASDFADLIMRIRAATAISDEVEIVIRTIDEELKCRGSVIARSIPNNRLFGASRLANVSFQISCSDPRRYSISSVLLSIGFPEAGGSGLIYPLDYPLDYGTPAATGSGQFNNEGDAALPVIITFNGPCENPQIYNDTTGMFLKFTIILSSSDQLVINTLNGTVELNGTDRLYTRSISSSPIASMELAPGVNDIRTGAESWSETASATIYGPSGAFL
ncbi:MAG TPA: hypothetical protein VLS45_03025 [Methylomicrobium sp.]|nr:hypothetical protein [Methylomicrobium sp.]